MNTLRYDGFAVREVGENPPTHGEDLGTPGGPSLREDRRKDQRTPGPGSWALYGHQSEGNTQVLMTSADREELTELCALLNAAVEKTRAGRLPSWRRPRPRRRTEGTLPSNRQPIACRRREEPLG